MPEKGLRERFWELPLGELSKPEWEALCDGCGRCCLVKLQDEDSGELAFTNLACRYLDSQKCQCRVYDNRFRKVPDCIQVTEAVARNTAWLPSSCAYRLRAHGQPLPDWHPLISGDAGTVRQAGISVAGRVVSEQLVHEDDWEEHIIHWIE
ncbi:YcgN family cysteine cluster protein [Alcanivorax sp.]|uniref:YcgN family cysteine cluster protein n=1 Tax=Alcanivorax sp. TaxID=1872427 RepID=UPI0025B85A8E|nr:YcgN family cysteine cluster protein [Alcanivorax sp.]